jgi:hypothetical protein
MRRLSITCILFLIGLILCIPNRAIAQTVTGGCAVPNVVGNYTLTGEPSGLLVIDSQSGSHIVGRYGQDENTLVSSIEGDFLTGDQCNVLSGTFENTQYNTKGIFIYTFSGDGASFTGSWRHHDGQYSGSWSGTRKGGNTTEDCSPRDYNCGAHTLPCCTGLTCTTKGKCE